MYEKQIHQVTLKDTLYLLLLLFAQQVFSSLSTCF